VSATAARTVADVLANRKDDPAQATLTGIHTSAAALVAAAAGHSMSRLVVVASSVTADPSTWQREQEKVDLQPSAGVRVPSGSMLPVVKLQ